MPDRLTLAVLVAVALAFPATPATPSLAQGPLGKAKEGAEAEKVEPVVIRMYNVQDLTLGRDYPYRGTASPVGVYAIESEYVASEAASFGDLFGGEPDLGEAAALTSALRPEIVADLITRTIDPNSWEGCGGRGMIDRVGALLVIIQTKANHDKVAELLAALRKARPMLTVEARWVLLDRALATEINKTGAGQKTAPVILSDQQVQDLEDNVIYRGSLTCFDRQTTHLASGRVQTLVSDAEPVVSEQAVGYNPELASFLVGALLEVTPSLAADRTGVTVDLRSVVSETETMRTSPVSSREGRNAESSFVEVDLPQFLLQTFRTTLRAPLGKAVLVGGMTSPGDLVSKELYLVLEIHAEAEP